jgi:predicted nucleotidyltransferase
MKAVDVNVGRGSGVFIRMTDELDRTALVSYLRAKAALFLDLGATGLYLFGSRARGDHRPDSDIDLFIDFDSTKKVPNLFKMVGAEQELTRELGLNVTITTRGSLHSMMKDEIEREAIRII